LQLFIDNGVKHMYRPLDKLQHSFLDFNQPMGLKMNPDNRWVKMADCIPWDEFEIKYAELSQATPAMLPNRCAWRWEP